MQNDDAPAQWSVEASTLVHQDKWLTVRADACRTPRGHVVAPFYVLEYPDWVTVFAVTDSDQVVLVQQYRHGAATMTSEFIAGSIEPSGETPLEAAKREVAEEVGLGGGRWWALGSAWVNAASHSNRVHYFLAAGLERRPTAKSDPAEVVKAMTLSFRELLRRTDSGELAMPSLSLTCLHLALRWLNGSEAITAAVTESRISNLRRSLAAPT